MKISFDSIVPVYKQIAQGIEDDIILGKLKEGEASYSQLIISKELGVNPATAAKGINLLVQKGILVKQRGLSMTVAIGAKNVILKEKTENDITSKAVELIDEAKKVNLSKEELLTIIDKLF